VAGNIDVLVVDDRRIDADVTMLAVRRAAPSLKALWIQQSDEALQFLFRVGPYKHRPHETPRLVLLDLETPVANGLSMLDLVRSHPETIDIPVVVLTDESIPLALRRGDAFDAHAYVPKPFDLEKYCLQIQRLLQQWLPRHCRPMRRGPELVPEH
jgi:CheY-like chemotaxis protein